VSGHIKAAASGSSPSAVYLLPALGAGGCRSIAASCIEMLAQAIRRAAAPMAVTEIFILISPRVRLDAFR
jgi:hypothetical protein